MVGDSLFRAKFGLAKFVIIGNGYLKIYFHPASLICRKFCGCLKRTITSERERENFTLLTIEVHHIHPLNYGKLYS